MTDNIKKEINDAKVSIDTLFVLSLVICGIAAIVFVAYLLYKPHKPGNEVFSRDIVVSSDIADNSEDVLESVDSAVEKSYLAPEVDEPKKIDIEPKKEEVSNEPIFKAVAKPKAVLVKTPVKTTVVKKTVKPKKKLVNVKGYWIQVGSFSTSAAANKSVEKLKERGLSSRVILKTVNGKSVYRVRIGAYETKAEADKFCNEVKKIEEFSGSYVSETTTQKYINI